MAKKGKAEKRKKTSDDSDSEFDWNSIAQLRERIYHRWTWDENLKYANFLSATRSEFDDYKERRPMKFFIRMAKALSVGKNNLQCRSHHQKMLKKFGTIDEIIRACLENEDSSEFIKLEQVSGEPNIVSQETEGEFKISRMSAFTLLTPF